MQITCPLLRYVESYFKMGWMLFYLNSTETHIHADFLSGVEALAQQEGTKVFLSAKGGRSVRCHCLSDCPKQWRPNNPQLSELTTYFSRFPI